MGINWKAIDPASIAPRGKQKGMSVAPLVTDFLASGMTAAELPIEEDEKGRKFASLLAQLRSYLKNHPDVPVSVTSQAGTEKGTGRIFLFNTTGEVAEVPEGEVAEAPEAEAPEAEVSEGELDELFQPATS